MKRKKMKMRKKVVSFLCIFALLITMMPVTVFAAQASDIANHWAKAQIGNLLEKGYITGYQDGTFKPDKIITRAEFMTIINRAFNFTEKADSSFTDVKAGAWYADVVRQAKAAGYIGGYPDGSIKPDNTVTRQEAATIIAKLKKLTEDASAAADFKDASKIAGWSKGYIGTAVASGLMKGYPDGSFQGANNITRAEAAVVLDKALLFEAYSSAGIYGPESGTKTVKGNAGVYADGVTLQNMVIEGDLLLAASIGEGTVTLKNVTVKGATNVKGGGEHSIIVIDSTLGNVKISKENGKIRIVVSGNTTVGQVTAASGVKLEESGMAGNAAGFREVVIDASGDDVISLVGTFDKVTVDAQGVTINVPSGSTVNTMVLNKAASVTGTGTIQLAQVKAKGVTFEKKPVTVKDESGAAQQPATTPSSGGGGGGGSRYADMVLKNGLVYSVNGTSKNAEASINEAVAIRDGKIIYVGSDTGVASYTGSKTQVIDLDGQMVLPGFADSHAHAKAMAANIFDLSLYTMDKEEPIDDEIIKATKAWMAQWGYSEENLPAYIMGNGWDTLKAGDMIANNDNLNAALDEIVPGVPVVLYDASHHQAWANEVAIDAARGGKGIDYSTPNPPGGVIGKDDDKETLTGIFQEDSGIGLVLTAIDDNEVWQYEAGILAYQEMANAYGLTLNQDPQVSENCIKAYENLAKAGKLTMRFRGGYLSAPVINKAGDEFVSLYDEEEGPAAKAQLDELAKNSAVKHTVGDLFQMNFIKIYGDGGGPTTWMKGGPETNVWPQDQLNYLSKRLVENGVQIHCHAMGDAALASFLDAFEYAQGDAPDVSKFRNSVTHLQFVDDGKNTFNDGTESTNDAERMAELGVIGIPQPFWMVKDPYFSKYWPSSGKARTEACYPMKSLIDAGVIMAGGSDWPVTQPNAPLTSIQIGVTRTLPYDDPAIAYTPDMARNPMYRTPLGPTGDSKKEIVDLKTMIQSVTINGAYAMFLENVTGSIEVGKSADMVVLDKNLLNVPKADIGKTNVMMTLFKGKIVYQASKPTVSDHEVIKYKSAPSYPGDPTPYSFVVAYGTTAQDFIGALNAPIGGSLDLVYSVGSDVELIGQEVPDEELVTESMELESTDQNGNMATYNIVVDAPEIPNAILTGGDKTYTVDSDTFVITLEKPIVGGLPDVYLLRTSDNISAVTESKSVTDISEENGAAPGTMFEVKAWDVNESTAAPIDPLDGKYAIYVYSPFVPPFIPFPDYVFSNQGEVVLTFK